MKIIEVTITDRETKTSSEKIHKFTGGQPAIACRHFVNVNI